MLQRHGRLYNDNEAISRAWKCLLLWRISILGGAFRQKKAKRREEEEKIEEAGGKGGAGGVGGGFPRGIYMVHLHRVT